MYSQGSAMSRRSGQSLVAIIGAFVVITILSYYSWSLSSENTALKGTIVMSYSKLKDMTTHKASLEKKNLLLSNRMVEMEDARDTEKQYAETELVERKKCHAKLSKSKDECSVKVVKKQEMLSRCEEGSTERESFLMEALNDVQLESLDHTAQADVVLAKIKHLKSKMKSTQHDYVALQNKFSDLEKVKINLQEANEKVTADNRKQKEFSAKSENSHEKPSSQTKKNTEAKKTKRKQKETGQKGKTRMHKAKKTPKNKANAKSGPKGDVTIRSVTKSLKPESQQTKVRFESPDRTTFSSGTRSNSNDANNATQLKNTEATETPLTDTSKVNKASAERREASFGNYKVPKTLPSEGDAVSENINEETEPSNDETASDKERADTKKNPGESKDSAERKEAPVGKHMGPKTIPNEDDDVPKNVNEETDSNDDEVAADKEKIDTKKNPGENKDSSERKGTSTGKYKALKTIPNEDDDVPKNVNEETDSSDDDVAADKEKIDTKKNVVENKDSTERKVLTTIPSEDDDVPNNISEETDGLKKLSLMYGQYNMEKRELPKYESAIEDQDTLQDLKADNINQE